MQLTLKQVAEIFEVTETRIIHWVNSDNLPAELVADQYRFHRADILEWAAIQNRSFSPMIYERVNGDLPTEGTHFTDALQAGGVLPNVTGHDLRSILTSALEGLPVPKTFGLENLIDLFLARESMGSTAIGNGIALPHPRRPVLLAVPGPIVRLCYLGQPLEMATPDDKPVDTLFLMICPTAHIHLQLLARLSALLQTDAVLDALARRLSGEPLFAILREVGRQFHLDAKT